MCCDKREANELTGKLSTCYNVREQADDYGDLAVPH